jgi:hypothetical protein
LLPRGDGRLVVSRDACCQAIRGVRRPRSALEIVVTDVVEGLDGGRGGQPGGDDLTAPGVFEGGQDAVAGGPVVHRVHDQLAGQAGQVEVGEAVQRDGQDHEVRAGYRVAGPAGAGAGDDQFGDQGEVVGVTRGGDVDWVARLDGQPGDDRPDVARAEDRDPVGIRGRAHRGLSLRHAVDYRRGKRTSPRLYSGLRIVGRPGR